MTRRKLKLTRYRDVSESLLIHGRMELLVRQMSPTINMIDIGTVCCVLQKAIKNDDLENTGVSLYEIKQHLIAGGYRREVVEDVLGFVWPPVTSFLHKYGEKKHQIGEREIWSPVLYLTTLGRLLAREYIDGAEVTRKDVRKRLRIALGIRPYQ